MPVFSAYRKTKWTFWPTQYEYMLGDLENDTVPKVMSHRCWTSGTIVKLLHHITFRIISVHDVCSSDLPGINDLKMQRWMKSRVWEGRQQQANDVRQGVTCTMKNGESGGPREASFPSPVPPHCFAPASHLSTFGHRSHWTSLPGAVPCTQQLLGKRSSNEPIPFLSFSLNTPFLGPRPRG